jgi:hypothetical protein
MSADWNWSQRDEAMAGRILAAPLAATGTLVVAGNAHTRTARTRLGVPLGARLAGQRPGLREIRIRYGGGPSTTFSLVGSAAVSVSGGGPSSANATGGSSSAAASSRPWSPSPAPSW